MAISKPNERDVFVNCPFDSSYAPMFEALVFAVQDAGFRVRCAKEANNATESRIAKILRIIKECNYGLHDISCTELDIASNLPRFNMPLELGLFWGCQHYGGQRHRKKACLVLDREPNRYDKFISDISGQDISCHDGTPEGAIREVRNWLRTESKLASIPGANVIYGRFNQFLSEMPAMCQSLRLDRNDLEFVDYMDLVTQWATTNP